MSLEGLRCCGVGRIFIPRAGESYSLTIGGRSLELSRVATSLQLSKEPLLSLIAVLPYAGTRRKDALDI